tara:strand:+ start:351 stop:485 length:135 start_codon:yes stop_codon:yes gene_type:complete
MKLKTTNWQWFFDVKYWLLAQVSDHWPELPEGLAASEVNRHYLG